MYKTFNAPEFRNGLFHHANLSVQMKAAVGFATYTHILTHIKASVTKLVWQTR